MLTIPAINGVYSMESLSGGTYHELTLVPKGVITVDVSVQTGPLYSYVASNNAVAHVMVG